MTVTDPSRTPDQVDAADPTDIDSSAGAGRKSVPRRSARSGTHFRWVAPLMFALPAILVFAYFSWGPMIKGIIMGWQKTNFEISTWVGWSNFTYVLQDPLLPKALGNTLVFVGLGILIGFPVPLFLAVFMSELKRGRRWFTLLVYLPVVVPPVVAILLWKTFYDPSPSGLANQLLDVVGAGPLGWLNSESLALPAMVLEATWAAAGTTVIIYLAALAGVRSELYEAADLDGASIARKVWHVTMPQLRGIILVLILLQIIGTMQVFAEPFLFTGGGPANSTMTLLLMIYNYAFVSNDFGAASALSVLLAVLLSVVSAIYFLLTRKWSKNS